MPTQPPRSGTNFADYRIGYRIAPAVLDFGSPRGRLKRYFFKGFSVWWAVQGLNL